MSRVPCPASRVPILPAIALLGCLGGGSPAYSQSLQAAAAPQAPPLVGAAGAQPVIGVRGVAAPEDQFTVVPRRESLLHHCLQQMERLTRPWPTVRPVAAPVASPLVLGSRYQFDLTANPPPLLTAAPQGPPTLAVQPVTAATAPGKTPGPGYGPEPGAIQAARPAMPKGTPPPPADEGGSFRDILDRLDQIDRRLKDLETAPAGEPPSARRALPKRRGGDDAGDTGDDAAPPPPRAKVSIRSTWDEVDSPMAPATEGGAR